MILKKHVSVFGLFARSSLFKVLLILLVLCAIEIVVFRVELQSALEAYEVVGSGMASLERMFERSAANVYFRAALILMTIAMGLPGCAFKSNTHYTLRRLSVSERATFFHQAAYNTLMYLTLIAVQLVLAFGLSQYYAATVPAECVSNQTVTLAFYRNEFLHSLLPLEDVGLWIRNGLLVISLGLAAAEFPYNQRRRKFSSTAIALCIYTIVFFDQGIGELFHVITTSIVALMVMGDVIYHLTRNGEEVAQNEQTEQNA